MVRILLAGIFCYACGLFSLSVSSKADDHFLKKHHLNALIIVSQGYDQCYDVQQCIRSVVPQALFIHCYAHIVNLVLVDAVKSVKDA